MTWCSGGSCEGGCSAEQCCDDDTCVSSCPEGECCNDGTCESSCPEGECCDDGVCQIACPDGECCDDGTCVSENLCPGTTGCCDDGKCVSACPGEECCSAHLCVSSCPEGEVCCSDDEECHEECENTEPTRACDTIHNEEYECIYCAPPGSGVACQSVTTRIYTGNIKHSCTGGCPGDCEEKPNVHCWTEYKCVEKDVLEDWACVVFGNGELGCVGPDMIVFCPRCKKNPEDPGEKYYVTHQDCK